MTVEELRKELFVKMDKLRQELFDKVSKDIDIQLETIKDLEEELKEDIRMLSSPFGGDA